MFPTTVPFSVYRTISKIIKALGPIGLPFVTGTISYLSIRGIAPTLKSIYRALHKDEDDK